MEDVRGQGCPLGVADDTQCVGVHRVCTRGGMKGEREEKEEMGERERERESKYGKQALQVAATHPSKCRTGMPEALLSVRG